MSKRSLAILSIFFAMISIQLGASLAKGLFPVVGAIGATTFRLTIASLILLIIWRPWRIKLSANSYKSIGIYGISLGLMNLLFYLSLERIPLGIAVALEFTGPLAISLVQSRKPVDFILALLAGLGIFLILPLGILDSGLDPIGIGFALSAGVCWAMYILFGQKAGKLEHGGVVTSYGMLMAAVIVLPFGLIVTQGALLNPSLLPLGITVAIFSSALPYSLEMVALKEIPSRTFGILLSLEPAIASLTGILILNEHLSLKQSIAIICVIVASLGGTFRAKDRVIVVPPDGT
jgi:inner membrane transporter RhtA